MRKSKFSMRCDNCGKGFGKIIEFENLNEVFCSEKCMKQQEEKWEKFRDKYHPQSAES